MINPIVLVELIKHIEIAIALMEVMLMAEDSAEDSVYEIFSQ